jgi:hypothetical protein
VPWVVEVLGMQDAYMDVGIRAKQDARAEHFNRGRPPWMAEVLEMQEQFPGKKKTNELLIFFLTTGS